MTGELTLDRLFRVNKTVQLPGMEVVVRALTDLERNGRYKAAALARAKLARQLDNPESDEHISTFGTAEELKESEIVEVILLYRQRDAMREASENVKLQFIPFPDNATESEIDKTHNEREDQTKKVQDERVKFVTNYLNELRENLLKLDRPALMVEYRKAVRDGALTTVYAQEIDIQSVYMALDGKMSYEDVRGMDSRVLRLLSSAVAEVDNIDPLLLKSPVSMGSSPEPSA